MFQELDTPPSRCCRRCGCAMSCVSLITADIDQAFEACSASAVLPAWRHISQSYESRFSSNSVLVRRGSSCFLQAWEVSVIWSRVVFVFNSRPGPAAVAVVLGAAELVWLGQWQKHRELGFHFRGRPVRSCISWKRYVDDVVVGSRVFCCSCIFVFLCACYQVPISLVSGAGTAVHTWVDVELRVIGQHVAVNIKNPNRSWVHGRGPQQKSTFLPWTGVLEGGLGCIRGVVLGHLARTKMLGLPEQFGVARLLECKDNTSKDPFSRCEICKKMGYRLSGR